MSLYIERYLGFTKDYEGLNIKSYLSSKSFLFQSSSFVEFQLCIIVPFFILLSILSHQIKNPNNLPLFDDDKTNKVVYELP